MKGYHLPTGEDDDADPASRTFALLLVSIALVVFLSERITRPIRKLTIAMKEIGAGNIDTVVLDEGEDELGASCSNPEPNVKKHQKAHGADS